MDKKSILRCLAVSSLLICSLSLASAQNQVSGEYLHGDYPGCRIILNKDKTFNFRFHFDLQWDLACGTYVMRGDTAFFSYLTDMFDPGCNTQGINVTDTESSPQLLFSKNIDFQSLLLSCWNVGNSASAFAG